jgi:hypothetical protein
MSDDRPGRARSQTTHTPREGLYRMITPIDHIDGLTMDEHDHNPSETPAGTPRTSLTLVNGVEGGFGQPIGENGIGTKRRIEPVFEEGHESEVGSPESHDQVLREKLSASQAQRPDQSLSKRETYSRDKEQSKPQSRRQSLTRKITGTLRPSASRLSEEQGQGVSPEERKWKDDIVTFDSKVSVQAR